MTNHEPKLQETKNAAESWWGNLLVHRNLLRGWRVMQLILHSF
jgi:hypothetical protein